MFEGDVSGFVVFDKEYVIVGCCDVWFFDGKGWGIFFGKGRICGDGVFVSEWKFDCEIGIVFVVFVVSGDGVVVLF